MKIFMGLTDTSGYFFNLKKGFNQLNVSSTFISLTSNTAQYDRQIYSGFIGLVKKLNHKRKGGFAAKVIYSTLFFPAYFLFVFWAVATHDTFIFTSNASFFRLKELPILKLLKKRLIYVFLGSDARPPYLNGAIIYRPDFSIEGCIQQTRARRQALCRIEKYADYIISLPQQGCFHTKSFVLGSYIGLPSSLEGLPKPPVVRDNEVVRILHCPSNLRAKGTAHIRDIIGRLKGKGYKLDYIEVNNQPNSVVLDEMARCDFLIDQMWSDLPMTVSVREAAFFGKPAVIGGYYSEYIQEELPENIIPPTLFCHPNEVEANIERLIADKEYRVSLGRQAQAYVVEHWNSRAIAERFLKLLNGMTETAYIFDPSEIVRLRGACIDIADLKQVVAEIVKTAGLEALMLSDKPHLREELLSLCGLEKEL